MMNKRTINLAVAILLSGTSAWSLQIPLSGGQESNSGGAKIGFVDMDRIFQIYPQTQAAKEDYSKQLKKKKEQLAAKEKELSEIKNKISVLESTLDAASTSEQSTLGTNETTPQPTSLPSMKADLENKRVEFEELRKQAANDLTSFQSQQSQMILGKIYQALRDLALEEQVSVVVDKASILYGDAAIDLTDKLQQKVRGY